MVLHKPKPHVFSHVSYTEHIRVVTVSGWQLTKLASHLLCLKPGPAQRTWTSSLTNIPHCTMVRSHHQHVEIGQSSANVLGIRGGLIRSLTLQWTYMFVATKMHPFLFDWYTLLYCFCCCGSCLGYPSFLGICDHKYFSSLLIVFIWSHHPSLLIPHKLAFVSASL